MKFHAGDVSVSTVKKMEIKDITEEIKKIVLESNIKNGLVNTWVPHATAAIAVNEHDTELWEDILATIERLVPIRDNYRHNAKYGWNPREQNSHAHILNCLIKTNATIPLNNGRLGLGTWQSILFIEMDGPRSRSVNVLVMGE